MVNAIFEHENSGNYQDLVIYSENKKSDQIRLLANNTKIKYDLLGASLPKDSYRFVPKKFYDTFNIVGPFRVLR